MLFRKNKFKNRQKVYIPKSAEFGRISQMKDGLIKVNTFRSNREMWLKPEDLENGE